MIELTGKTNALKAINLSNLLTEKWTEGQNAYQICSKIKTVREETRLNDLCSNRYKS